MSMRPRAMGRRAPELHHRRRRWQPPERRALGDYRRRLEPKLLLAPRPAEGDAEQRILLALELAEAHVDGDGPRALSAVLPVHHLLDRLDLRLAHGGRLELLLGRL